MANARADLERCLARCLRHDRRAGGHRRPAAPPCRRARRRARHSRLGAGLALGLLLLLDAPPPLLLLLELRAGIEHLPPQQHRHREHDGHEQVLLAVLVLVHERLDAAVCTCAWPPHRPLAGARCTRSNALTRSDTQRAEVRGQRRPARDQDIVELAPGVVCAHDFRTAALRRRLMRLRSTALPTWRVTVKPKRACARIACARPAPRRCALGLEHERRRRPARALAHPQELCAPLQGSSRLASRSLLRSRVLWPLPVHRRRHALRRTGACGPSRAVAPRPRGRPWSPCACGTHGGACARACSADRSVSLHSPSLASSCRGSADARRQRGAARPSRRAIADRRRSEVAALIGFWAAPSQSEGKLTFLQPQPASILGNPGKPSILFAFSHVCLTAAANTAANAYSHGQSSPTQSERPRMRRARQ